MRESIGVGVIGCGAIAVEAHLPNYAADGRARLVAVADVDRARAEEAAARFGFRFPDAAEREALRGCAPREILRRLAVPAWKLPAIAAHLRRRKAEAAHLVPLFGGVHAMLRELAERRRALQRVSFRVSALGLLLSVAVAALAVNA